ncbi:MAG: porin, partial [Pseudomonadota bacterium]|nr:porin [Pseudomonadota bacterium]
TTTSCRRIRMNKKLLTLAIVGVLTPAAVCATAMADVTISGYANVSVDSMKNGASGAAERSGSYVSSNASNIDINANTDIGNGMKALFSSQTFVSLGSDNNPPAGNAAGFSYDQFSNGNTYAGLEGGFGMIAAGRNDSPMKQLGRAVDLFGNEIGDSRNITSGANVSPLGVASGANHFDLRPGHTVFYVSPDLGGVTVKAAYTMENSAVDASPSGGLGGVSAVPPAGKGSATSVSAVYNQGPLLAGLAYEYHSASTYASLSSSAESAIRAAASLNLDPVRVTALYQHDSNISGTSSASLNVWGLGVAYTFIPDYAVKAQYYGAANVGGTNNTGAHMVAVGVTHTFSPNASAYLDYAKTYNQTSADYGMAGGGHGNVVLTPVAGTGANPYGVSLGMIYTF